MKKKVLIIISLVMIWFALRGVFLFMNRYSENGQINRIYRTDKEAVVETEKQIIEALNAKDSQLLKDVFSKDAIAHTNDLDIGVEYLLGLLDGGIVDVYDSNFSTTGYYDSGKKTSNISAWCYLTTATSTYKLSYVFYSINESNPEKEGVYRLNLYRTDDFETRYRIAGIDYPEREHVHEIADEILLSIQEKNILKLQGLFDEKVLEEVQDFDLGAKYAFDILEDSEVIGNHDSWIIREELSDGNVYQAYIAMETTKGDFILMIEYSVEQELVDSVKLRKMIIKPIDITTSYVTGLEKIPDRQGIYHSGWN